MLAGTEMATSVFLSVALLSKCQIALQILSVVFFTVLLPALTAYCNPTAWVTTDIDTDRSTERTF